MNNLYTVDMKVTIAGPLLALSSVLLAQGPQSVRVPDEATAISIAKPALIKVYGERQIKSEEPLKAVLKADVWHVYGSLCCYDSKGVRTCDRCNGGVAEAQVRRDDGRILGITHTK